MARRRQEETKTDEKFEVIINDEPKKQRGRQAGYEKQEIIVQITDTYRINLSDGRNKTLQRLTVKTNDELEEETDSEDEDAGGWKFKGHFSTYKAAFNRLHDLMVIDGIIAKGGCVTTPQFEEIYEEKLKWLQETFKSDFADDEVVANPKRVKKVIEKKER